MNYMAPSSTTLPFMLQKQFPLIPVFIITSRPDF